MRILSFLLSGALAMAALTGCERPLAESDATNTSSVETYEAPAADPGTGAAMPPPTSPEASSSREDSSSGSGATTTLRPVVPEPGTGSRSFSAGSASESSASGASAPGAASGRDRASPPDNTAINERDADGKTKTPLDQSNDADAIQTTARIRDRIASAEDISIYGQNVKIITADGKVTLRGPVASQEEKDAIEKIAKEVAGQMPVENLLEVGQER